MKLKLYTDGGARRNPGPAAAGAVLKDTDGKVVDTVSRYLGETTNNQAEYMGLIIGLERAKHLKAKEIDVYMDSELAVKQLKGEYKVKNQDLAKRFVEVLNLTHDFKKVKFHHITRDKNQEADTLVNKSIDEHIG